MDFSTIEQKSEAFCHLVHPAAGPMYETGKDGKPDYDKPIGIYHEGQDSAPYRRKLDEQMRRANGKRQQQKSLNDIEADSIERTASVCTRAENITYSGKELKTEADFVAFFTEHKWAFRQVTASISDDANFF